MQFEYTGHPFSFGGSAVLLGSMTLWAGFTNLWKLIRKRYIVFNNNVWNITHTIDIISIIPAIWLVLQRPQSSGSERESFDRDLQDVCLEVLVI